MKIALSKILLLSFILVTLSIGCKKNAQTKEPLVGGDLAVYLLGDRVPNSVELDKNSIATVSFVGSTVKYKFDLNADFKNANSYWGRLVNAQKNATTVKVYITNVTKIVKVE